MCRDTEADINFKKAMLANKVLSDDNERLGAIVEHYRNELKRLLEVLSTHSTVNKCPQCQWYKDQLVGVEYENRILRRVETTES